MRPPLLERLRARLCRLVGHRLDADEYAVTCRRCRRLLAGTLNRLEPVTRHRWDR